MKSIKINTKSILYVNLFFFFLFLLIVCTKGEPVKTWDFYPDSYDYITQSKHNFTSIDLYSPKRAGNINARAWTVPFFYKLTGSDFYTFISFQTVFYCLCVFLFISCMIAFVENLIVKMIFIPILYFFFSWWNIVGWTTLGVSEHLSFCFLLLWLATLLLFLSKKNWKYLILHFVVCVFHSFTRDTWSYLLVLTPLVLAVFYIKDKKFILKYFGIYLVFSLTIFFIQQKTVNKGERYRLSVYNNIFVRLAKNPEYMEWFKKRGLPLADKISADFHNFNVDNREDVIKLYSTYYDNNYVQVFDWVVKKGKSTYTRFLITHPSYLLLQDQSSKEKERIFCYNLHYAGAPTGYFLIPNAVFPVFNTWVVIAMSILILIIYFKRPEVDYRLLFPIFLLILATANVFLSYNAEAMEVDRHMYYTKIITELVAIINLFLLADYAVLVVKERRGNKDSNK